MGNALQRPSVKCRGTARWVQSVVTLFFCWRKPTKCSCCVQSRPNTLPSSRAIPCTHPPGPKELHVDTWTLLLKRCQGENELEDELLKVKHPHDIYQKLLTTQNPEYRGCLSLDMRLEALTKTQSSVLRVWSKVHWRFNSEVPTQSIFRLIFHHEVAYSYNSPNLHRPNVQGYCS